VYPDLAEDPLNGSFSIPQELLLVSILFLSYLTTVSFICTFFLRPTGIPSFADSSSKAFLASNCAGVAGYPPSPPLSQSFFSFNHPNVKSCFLYKSTISFPAYT